VGRARIPREKPEFESNTPPSARQCAGETVISAHAAHAVAVMVVLASIFIDGLIAC
jgi:hypothetical protein